MQYKSIITRSYHIQKKCHLDEYLLQAIKYLERQKFKPESSSRELKAFLCYPLYLSDFIYICMCSVVTKHHVYLPESLKLIHKRRH